MVRAPMADRLIASRAGRRGARRDSGENLATLVAGTGIPQRLNSPPRPSSTAPDLGALDLSRSGVRSSVYGTLAFQTPIVEIPLDEATQLEAQAYRAWRDGYQRELARHLPPDGPAAGRATSRSNGRRPDGDAPDRKLGVSAVHFPRRQCEARPLRPATCTRKASSTRSWPWTSSLS